MVQSLRKTGVLETVGETPQMCSSSETLRRGCITPGSQGGICKIHRTVASTQAFCPGTVVPKPRSSGNGGVIPKLDETKDWKTKPPSFVVVDERGSAFLETFRPCRTVWFNAWKYGREEALFVALIEEVLRQMRRDGAMQALYAELADPKQDKLKVSEAVLSTLTRVFTAGKLDIDLTAFQTESRFSA